MDIVAAIAAFAGKETAFTPLDDDQGAPITEMIRNSYAKDAAKAGAGAWASLPFFSVSTRLRATAIQGHPL